MAYVPGGKHFGQYTYEHWYDHEYKDEVKNANNADPQKLLKGFSYNGHLGGTLGNRIFARLVELGWFEQEENGTDVYKITPLGEQKLTELGVDIFNNDTAPR